MNIVIIASNYPSIYTPTSHVFLQKIVWEFADKGHNCTIISPVAFNNLALKNLPLERIELSNEMNEIKIFHPRYINFGFSGKIPILQNITMNSFTKSIHSILNKKKIKVDVLYSHFITPAGIAAARVGKSINKDVFIAFGESNLWSIEGFGTKKVIKELENVKGFIAVSSENKKRLIDSNISDGSNIKVLPNGVDLNRFKPMNQQACREHFEFNKDDFILVYVGQFNERKGIMRVSEAIKELSDVKIAYIGKGPLKPDLENCIYIGTLSPDLIPKILNAGDVFILPTLNEGCCNAIVEASACGLPVISSNLKFNEDILSKYNSVKIDPQNIDEIRQAVITLKNDKLLRKTLKEGALKQSELNSISKRADRILEWMKT